MPLSKEYKQQIRENLDMDEGGRLHALAGKAKAIDAPVLIVGLGGTGVDALLITKKLIHDSMECEKMPDGFSDKPQNIEYLAIDTDVYYRNKSYRGMRLNRDADELMIYTMADASPILKHPELQPPYIQSWLNPKIDTTTVINGAGAVRQLGRLMLMENLGKLQQVLNFKISRVTQSFASCVPLYVFILAGISGSTGGGSFLDIPYMIKETAAQVTYGRTVMNIGLLFMPDINANKTGVNENKRLSIYANGYAALKELDYLMNIGNTGDQFEQEYGELKVGKKDDRPYLPYDACFLMSGKDKRGRMIRSGDESYRAAVETAAETVSNFVFGSYVFSKISDFPIHRFFETTWENIDIYKRKLGNDRRPAAYYYSASGAVLAELPTDELMSYLTYKAFREIEGYWNRRPTDEDVDEVMRWFGLSKSGIIQATKSRVRFADLTSLTFRMIKDSPEAAVQICEEKKKRQEEVIEKKLSDMLAVLEQRIRDKDNIINQYFQDLGRGPVFAQRCLYSADRRVKCVINELINMADAFAADKHNPDEMDRLERNAAEALNQICNGNVVFGKGSARNKYIEAMDELYRAHFKNMLCDQLAQFCRRAAQMFEAESNRTYGTAAELLEELVPQFLEYKTFKVSRAGKKNRELISWYLEEPSNFIQEVEKRIDTDPAFTVDMQVVVFDFYRWLLENAELWTGSRKNVAEHINAFIHEKFRDILDHDMDFFLKMLSDEKGKTLSDYCDTIINTLCAATEIHFPIDETAVGANAEVPHPEFFFISIPDNSLRLFEAVERKRKEPGMNRSIVQRTRISDRIFVMRIQSAIPLCHYADLKMLYEVYKEHKDQKGLHLYEPNAYSDVDWRNLPSPCPETE